MSSRRKQSKPRALHVQEGGEYMEQELVIDEENVENQQMGDLENFIDEAKEDLEAERVDTEPDALTPASSVADNSQGGADCQNVAMMFACSYCNQTFLTFNQVREHELVHSDEMPYQCDFCHRPFRHKRSRDRHMKLHTGDKNYKCTLCDSAFSRSDHLKNHLRSHSSGKWTAQKPTPSNEHSDANSQPAKSKDDLQCQLCDRMFTNFYHLDEHLKESCNGRRQEQASPSSSLAKPLEYHCTHCAKQSLKHVFASLQALEQHVSHMHSGKGLSLLSCPHCERGFPTVPTLNDHIEQHHDKRKSQSTTREGAVRCNLCNKVFTCDSQLLTHMAIEHGSKRSSESTSRDRSSSQGHRESLSTPLDLSARSSPPLFACPVCHDGFSSPLSLVEHSTASHKNAMRSRCQVCSEVILTSQQHLEHMERHYVSTMKSFACRSCKQGFNSVDDLQSHLISDHAKRFFSCLLCTEIYQTEVDLKIHMTVEHSNESKRYRCTCCGRDYDDITTWRAHMLNAHMDLIVGETRSPKDLQCPYCSKTFQADTELTVHILTHQKLFSCTLCKEQFQVEYFRDKHMQMVHSTSASPGSSPHQNGNPFWCGLCDRVFHSEDVFEEHKRKSHSVLKAWQKSSNVDNLSSPSSSLPKMFSTACPSCGKAFKSYAELDKHSRVHFGPVTLSCVICDQACSSLPEMAKHKLQHCKVPSMKPCILCPVSITSPEAYLEHATSHIEPDSTVICPVCKHKITSQVELELHAKFHLPKKPTLRCASCQKKCPYFIHLPTSITENPQFLLCQECLVARQRSANIIIPVLRSPDRQPTPPGCQSSSASPQSVKDQRVSPSSAHRCKQCSVKFESIAELEKHSCSWKACAKCAKTFKSSELVGVRDELLCPPCHATPTDMWKCDKCKLTFTHQKKYQKHNCVALGNGKSCHMCHGRFKHSQLLLRGDRLVCKLCDRKLVTCRSCGETYLSEEKHACRRECIACHESFTTMGEATICNLCVERRSLEQVTRVEASEEPPQKDKVYQCIKCQMSYKSEQEIRLHVLTYHISEKTHKCHLCSGLFESPAKLQAHLIDHDFAFNERLVCPKCDWVTSEAATLMNHCVTQHSVASRSFTCPYCHQSFFFEAELLNHSFTHQENGMRKRNQIVPPDERTKRIKREVMSDEDGGDDMFCSKCDAEFSCRDQYIYHISKEHADTQQTCVHCKKLFCNEEDLQEHVVTAHPLVETTSPNSSGNSDQLRAYGAIMVQQSSC